MLQTNLRRAILIQLVLCMPCWAVGSAVDPAGRVVIEEPMSLEGLWSFRPGDDRAWAGPGLDDSGWQQVRVPHLWSADGFADPQQRAWYRRVVELPVPAADARPLALRMGAVRNAYELWLDGRPVGGVGALPPDPDVNYDRIRVYPIPPELLADGRLVIAVRVWGGNDLAVRSRGGGLYAGPVLLGDHGALVHELAVEDMTKLVFAALFGLVGLYFLYLFVRSRALRSSFWFGATSLALAPWVITQSQWKYSLDLPWLVLEKIEGTSFMLVLVLMIQLVWTVLGRRADWWMRVFQGLLLLLAALVLLVPGLDIHNRVRAFWQYAALASGPAVIWVIASTALRGNRDARVLLGGLLVFTVFATHDLIVNMGAGDGMRLIPLGFLAILTSMGVILADRFASLLDTLESQVEQRTGELREANDALAAANERLKARSRLDPLTGLLNRRGFEEEVAAELRRVERGAEPPALVLLDVDHFKRFNDEHGHACGDQVLCDVSELLRARTREVDRVGRWGGEEFVLLLPATDAAGLVQATEKLRAAIEAHEVEFEDRRLGVTATFGAAVLRDGESFEACLERADQALYAGKAGGRNRVELAA